MVSRYYLVGPRPTSRRSFALESALTTNDLIDHDQWLGHRGE